MRIIVTGGSGRLGRSVVAGLAAAGHTVTSIDRARAPVPPDVDQIERAEQAEQAERAERAEHVEHVEADLLDADATAALFSRTGPDAVIHLAGIAVPFSRPEREILLTNTALAWTVLEAAVAAGAGRVLVASSPTPVGYGAPAGWQPDYLPIDERHALAPWHAYALSKVVVEETVRTFVRTRGATTRFGVFRPCFVISPEEWEGAPTQQGHTLVDRLADPGLAAVSLFNYVDARDVAAFVVAWLERAEDVPNGTCFFIGADDALATEPLASLIPRHLPGSEPIAGRLTGRQPAFSNRLARDLLGWHPAWSWRTALADPLRDELAARIGGHPRPPAKESVR
ncbi:NAD-dependent epimerase/dehydratase family protein [Parafrankia elaeagni]|uniref:NAD-dependent epimerase/dehydratase family protein n=1 Tax=Parafrankia elaeagni TaxID=222534 RepID=UPI0003771C27|nr:NAD(P)-dependent oxidoreductase [Parafrankia elaeagni]